MSSLFQGLEIKKLRRENAELRNELRLLREYVATLQAELELLRVG